MSKLKCKRHDRRVMFFRNEPELKLRVLHREDGSSCDTGVLVIGQETVLRGDLLGYPSVAEAVE